MTSMMNDDDFDARADALAARICQRLADRSGDGHIQVAADSDDDYDLFEVVAARLFEQCGVLSVHASQTSPLVFEIGPTARDVWGSAIAKVLDAVEAHPAIGADFDTDRIYEQTAVTWRNLLRLYPLSMTPYEETLMVRLAEDMAAERDLVVVPIERHRFHVHAPRTCLLDDDVQELVDNDEGDIRDNVQHGMETWWTSFLS